MKMALLKAVEVTKMFGDFKAVDSVSISIEKNDAVGIIGPNGAGKTTFLNIITGCYIPEKGFVYFNDENITRVRPEKRVDMGLNRTFQLVHVFDNLSVYENLAISYFRKLKGKSCPISMFYQNLYNKLTKAKVDECLGIFGFKDVSSELVGSLSLGNKKKLEIAMAHIVDPEVLLLDEPFAGLGDHEIDEILTILTNYKKNKTMLIIEHKISKLTQVVDKIAVMCDGKIIAYGPSEETLNHPEVRKSYWKIK